MTVKFCLGFAFNHSEAKVLLIIKERPKWQEGKLNGIGGKIQDGEKPVDAMVREFSEEATLQTTADDWTQFCVLNGEYHGEPEYTHFEMYCFSTALDRAEQDGCIQATDEQTGWYQVRKLMDQLPVIPNLKWLIPMALDRSNVYAAAFEGGMEGAKELMKWHIEQQTENIRAEVDKELRKRFDEAERLEQIKLDEEEMR